MHTKLGKVFDAYCERQGLNPGVVRFLHDGSRVNPDDTPQGLEMEDNDVVQVMVEQQGGVGSDAGSRPPTPPAVAQEETPPKSELLSIRVREQNDETAFRVKKRTKMGKIMSSYYRTTEKKPNTLRFFFDGHRIQDEDTPETLELEEDDVIDAHIEQLGGDGSAAPDATNDAPAAGADGAAPQPDAGPEKIQIMVKDDKGHEQHYQIKISTKMEKVMNAYAVAQGRDPNSYRFFTADGARINPDHTPESLDMEDGDTIDAHEGQIGGGGGGPEESQAGSKDENRSTAPELADKPQDELTPLSIAVREQNGEEITFQLKKVTKLQKLMKAYCKAAGRAEDSVRFFTPDGKRVNPTDTPVSCGLEDGDLLDVQLVQQGGGAVAFGVVDKKITIDVTDANNDPLSFQVRIDAKLSRLMDAFCRRRVINRADHRFVRGHILIHDDDTPASLGLKEGSLITARPCVHLEGVNQHLHGLCPIVRIMVKDPTERILNFDIPLDGKVLEWMGHFYQETGRKASGCQFLTHNRLQHVDNPAALGVKEGTELYVIAHLESIPNNEGNVVDQEMSDDGCVGDLDEFMEATVVTTKVEKARGAMRLCDGEKHHITLKVSSADRDLHITIKTSTALSKLMGQFNGKSRFRHYTSEGVCINGTDTAASLGFEDGSTITATKLLEIKVQDVDGCLTYFNLKPTTLLEKVMAAYAEHIGQELGMFRFYYAGLRIYPDDTPKSLEMVDGDTIVARDD